MKKFISALVLCIVSTFLLTSCGNNENVQNKPYCYGAAEIMGVPVYGNSSDFISKISTFGNVQGMDTIFLDNSTTVITWFLKDHPVNEIAFLLNGSGMRILYLFQGSIYGKLTNKLQELKSVIEIRRC